MSEPPPLFSIRRGEARRRGRSPGGRGSKKSRTSDLTRVRDMVAASVAAGFAVAMAWWLLPSSVSRVAAERSPGSLGLPHTEANLACPSCHGAEGGAKASCVGCHAPHPSTRAAHRALASRGELGCASCHVAHGASQGVTFTTAFDFLRWGGATSQRGRSERSGPLRASVPLVTTDACARCHDAANTRDPISACLVPSGAGAPAPSFDMCFDEHQHGDERGALPSERARSVCAHQHGPARFLAWDAARDAAHRVPWVTATLDPSGARARGPAVWLGIAAVTGILGYAASAGLRRVASRRADAMKTPRRLSPPVRVRLPQINTATCLGCYACVDACPFDVLEIQRYVAVVTRPADCCGAILCQQVCPNDSLQITEGAKVEGRPRVDEHLESKDAPGVFLAGDLTGLPLIKNAIAQGAQTITRIAKLPRGHREAGTVDVAILGAGPAGISAALRAHELGLSYVVLEQGSVASSIRSFPRGKLVFDQPLAMPVEGALWLRESTKEELLAQWTRIVRTHRLAILEGHRVTSIARSGAAFVLTAKTHDGERAFAATRLVLAIGRRGTPRLLDCHIASGAEAKVSYAVADARSFAGKRVLIVGLGDSAMEVACAIARQPGTSVTISCRGKDFARGKARNIAEVKALAAKNKLRLAFETEVERVDPATVMLRTNEGREEIANDLVVVLIGGVPSWDLVRAAGVSLDLQPSTTA